MKTLKDVTDDEVSAYVVWLPIFGGDFKGEARKLSNSFRDKRVSYFLDPESETGKHWQGVLKTPFLAWDVYMLYGPDAEWGDRPDDPAYWMHRLMGVTNAPRYQEETFRSKLKEMVDELKLRSAAKPEPGKTRIEFLYFESCPGYRQSLANLESALKESRLAADLILINVATEAQAVQLGFQGSPSIRVNGNDLEGRNSGHAYSCRIYRIDGKYTAVPTKAFIKTKLKELTR